MYDRFTRDEVSSWVWWPATMVLVVLLVLTFPGENRAIEQRRDDAAAQAWTFATGAIAPALADADVGTIQGDAAARLSALVQERALGAPWAEVVRIWADDSTMLWSSDPSDPVGSAGGLNDEDIVRANADLTRALQVVRDRNLDGRPAETTFSAYAPFTLGDGLAAAQFEVADAALLGDVRGDWLGYRIVFGLAAALTLALAIGSMREPIARIGAGVPVYRAAIPRGMDVMELDRKLELERAGANARERVAHMDARLRESEELRLKAEGDLQRALSQLATQPGRPARSVIPRPAIPEPATPTVAPTATPPAATPPATTTPVVPPATTPPAAIEETPAPAAEAPRDGLTLVPPLEERSRTAAAREPTPEPPRQPEHPVRTHPSRRRPAAAATWEPAPRRSGRDEAAPTAAPPAPAPPPAPALDAPAPDAPAASTASAVRSDADPIVVVPDAGATLDPTDPEAREVLERLVEPIAVSVAPADDPSVLRAKLARTAARKKPGSRREERIRDDDAT